MRPSCDRCQLPIEDYADSGRLGRSWLHKACWLQMWREGRERGADLPVLTSPVSQPTRELSVLAFALMFHFGIGLAMIGWILLSQEDRALPGAIILAVGAVSPVVGVLGIVYSVYRRKQFESVISELGGERSWTPVPTPETSR